MIRLTYNEHSPELFAELKALAKPAAPPAPIALPELHHRPSVYPARWQPLDRLMQSAALQEFLGLDTLAVYRDPAVRETVFRARRKKCGHQIGFRAPDAMIEDVQIQFCGWLCRMFDSIPCDCTPATSGTFSTEPPSLAERRAAHGFTR